MKNFELISFAGPDLLANAAASAWLDEIEAAARAGKTHCAALAGGRITQKFYVATAEKASARKTPFGHVHFFWSDERCVPPSDPESNFKLAADLLFAPLKIPNEQIHRILGELAPENAVIQANKDARSFCQPGDEKTDGAPVFDLVFGGLGEDGHVASLFQNARFEPQESAKCNDPFFFVPNSPKPPPRRISLNYNAFAVATQVWILASGKGKEAALQQSLSGEGKTPLGRVIDSRRKTKIFVDIPLRM